ncbi:MAG TPA: PAS-domain containing protein [Caulobacteraceae bacterium]|nr:PAS-domain containing protein [Caulobacteraceae bacterium]
MDAQQLLAAAAAGAVFLALGAALLALLTAQGARVRVAAMGERLAAAEARATAIGGAADIFDEAVLALEDGEVRLVFGPAALTACAAELGAASAAPDSVLEALRRLPGAEAIDGLIGQGRPCVFEAAGRATAIQVEGRPAGALTLVKLRRLDAAAARPKSGARAAVRPAGEGKLAAQLSRDAILDHVGDAVAVFGSDQRLRTHNAAFAALFGLEAGWLAESPSHGELIDRLRQRRRLPETDDFAGFRAAELARHDLVEPSADAIWRLPSERTLKVVSLPDPGGGIAMVFSDITAELRLRTQFNQLIQVQQATLDKLSDAVAVFGADGRLKLYNEAFETFWGLPAGALEPQLEFDAVRELCLRRLHDLQFWRDLKGRITDADPVSRSAVSAEITTADGRAVAFQSRPLPDGATLISFSDITDARRLQTALADREAALAEAERLKREFVGSVSYELRTPLTTIIGYTELLESAAAALGERERGHLASVRAAATQLARSIDNVLDMAEIDAGEMALDMADVDVAGLLEKAAEKWAAAAAAAGIDLEVDPTSEAGLIRGDARRLSQVIDHLAENAIRHTPAGGRVRLAAERAASEIRLIVADTGRGIPFHVQAHVFNRFGGPAGSSPGLGLALVRAIVELHGGWVDLESEPGAGARFTCHLPEAAQAQAARPELF